MPTSSLAKYHRPHAAPRFFVETDEVVLSANVHNSSKDAKQSKSVSSKKATASTSHRHRANNRSPAGGEHRVDWRVKATHEGEATIRMAAAHRHRVRRRRAKVPVYVHGMPKMDSFSGTLRPNEDHGSFEIVVPSERRAEETRLEVRYSPTLAGAMVAPSLSRRIPTAAPSKRSTASPRRRHAKTLLGMHLDLKSIQQKRTNLNAQEIGDDAERAKGWKRYDRNPVFDEAELTKIVKQVSTGSRRCSFSDGGWGWFSGWGEQSSAHTTHVVHGLQLAKATTSPSSPHPRSRHRVAPALPRRPAQSSRQLDANGNPIDKTKPYKLTADNMTRSFTWS